MPTAGETYAVNTTADTVDADQGNPLCADAAGHCSLRAAIMQANFTTGPNTITVPSGVYLLTRTQPGNDDDVDVVGDLDVTGDLTIQGAGSGTTIVDGNGAVTHDRVFQILDTAVNVSLSNLTIRAGQQISNTFDEGGGLNWQGANGADLRLTNVVFENNQASYDGGLALNYSSSNATVDLENVTFHANRATAAVGGLGVAFGGDFDQFTLRNSRVYSNSAYEGGGLYFSGEIYPPGYASLEADAIYSNTAFLSAGLENHAGFATNPLLLVDSRLDDNDAGYYGGAIGNYGRLAILTTTLDANLASQAGGGVYNYEGGQVDLEQSTLSNNQAQFGGGLYSELFIHGSSVLTFTNSTVSDNIASRDGAGLYLVGGRGGLFNTTIADNHVQVPLTTTYAGLGGGVYISQTSIVQFQNTLIAGNFHQYQALAPVPDDCYGPLDSLGYNLIQSVTNCAISDQVLTLYEGYNPLLGPLTYNGGPTQTRALLSGSVAIDNAQANMPGCTGPLGAPLTIDQRGRPRPNGPHCDIGAFEYYVSYPAFLPFIGR